MEDVLRFNSIQHYNAFNKNETLHPLVSIVDLSKADPRESRRMAYEFYVVYFPSRFRETVLGPRINQENPAIVPSAV